MTFLRSAPFPFPNRSFIKLPHVSRGSEVSLLVTYLFPNPTEFFDFARTMFADGKPYSLGYTSVVIVRKSSRADSNLWYG